MKLTWAEIHMFECGLGDSLSRKRVNWRLFLAAKPKYIKQMMGELHYYQMGVFIPRAALISIGIALLIQFLS